MVLRRLLLLGLIALTGACAAPAGGEVIDGWELGEPASFSPDPRCDREAEYLRAATRGIDETIPHHPQILDADLYLQKVHATPGAVLSVRSGGPVYVAVFLVADGTRHAIGAGRIGIGGVVPFDAPDRPRWAGGAPAEAGGCGPQIAS